MDKIVGHWVERSQYDLDTAKVMLDTGRYLYVAYMCQQTVEKMLKALKKIQDSYRVDLYGYGLDESTYKLMRMSGFKKTEIMIKTDNNLERRLLCLQQQ